eukprot:1143106-Pelagomonas_calceolata.AAC.3
MRAWVSTSSGLSLHQQSEGCVLACSCALNTCVHAHTQTRTHTNTHTRAHSYIARPAAAQGVLPESALRLRDKVLDAGSVPLGATQTLTAQLLNSGTRAAAFCVLPNPLLKCLCHEGETLAAVLGFGRCPWALHSIHVRRSTASLMSGPAVCCLAMTKQRTFVLGYLPNKSLSDSSCHGRECKKSV